MENSANDRGGLHVKILRQDKCIYENEFKSQSNPVNDLKSLITNMENAQCKINCFLTDLIKQEEGCTSSTDSDVDDDFENAEGVVVVSKKCKLTN